MCSESFALASESKISILWPPFLDSRFKYQVFLPPVGITKQDGKSTMRLYIQLFSKLADKVGGHLNVLSLRFVDAKLGLDRCSNSLFKVHAWPLVYMFIMFAPGTSLVLHAIA